MLFRKHSSTWQAWFAAWSSFHWFQEIFRNILFCVDLKLLVLYLFASLPRISYFMANSPSFPPLFHFPSFPPLFHFPSFPPLFHFPSFPPLFHFPSFPPLFHFPSFPPLFHFPSFPPLYLFPSFPPLFHFPSFPPLFHFSSFPPLFHFLFLTFCQLFSLAWLRPLKIQLLYLSYTPHMLPISTDAAPN